MNTEWKEIAGDMLEPKLMDIYSQKTVLDEKDTTESDSKQKMSWWNWTESSSSSTNWEIETSHYYLQF